MEACLNIGDAVRLVGAKYEGEILEISKDASRNKIANVFYRVKWHWVGTSTSIYDGGRETREHVDIHLPYEIELIASV